MGIKVEEDFSDFIKELIVSFAKLQMLDGATIVEEGQLVDSSIPINETLLSNNEKDAKDEYNYLQGRKTGEEISPEEIEKIERLERDVLKEKSNGLIYGEK